MPYKFYNANSRGNYVNDCTVRAISLAEDISWNEAFKKLSRIAEKEGILLDDVEFIENYLDDRYPRQCHYSKTVGEFAMEHHRGIYLVTMKGHITCMIDGTIFDTFDCSMYPMWCAWQVK